MNLIEHPAAGRLAVQWVRADAIAVAGTLQRRSFLLGPNGLRPDWPPASVEAIDQAALDALLALEPELILLGTGQRQRFPAAKVMAACLTRGVGIEVMDNAAAGRTYTLLAGEGRRVLAAFLLPG